MTSDVARLVLDANIMISAVLGRSFPFLLNLFENGVQLMSPVHQFAETRHKLTQRPGIPGDWVDQQMERLAAIVMPLHPGLLASFEDVARRRLARRGQPDWPVLAATYAADGAAWSHDKDLFGSGAPVWSTKVLMRETDWNGIASGREDGGS